ncbi:Structural maintenance of chromosomes protein 4 [Golovinomyces cichoracearum]|uniref:Structural maintenance of chromosomes protein n=1 Tax=Golovinomyces cichoracearum TaxID=62708 RepID=A0A420IJB1_9PEZI|nr:Structural maintenance of chromosomes protein 4 [Golovinomyces cichoracearum]
MSENRTRIFRKTRRTIVPESDDEEQVWVGKEEKHGQGEGGHTPAPRKSLPKAITSRRKSRNRTAELSQSRDYADESPSEKNHKTPDRVYHTDHKTPELVSPLRKASLCEQKIETCQSIHENVSMNMSIIPLTPKPSQSPEPVPQNVTAFSEFLDPLHGHITSAEYSVSTGDQIKSENLPEKPIDIVLKSRSMVIPIREETSPKPRIVITYLTLTNFKSYAGRQEVGPFHTSFSSVVGPNGSGKSNVIDSLLFVFGFRASKMRQGKISALIHKSAEHPNLDHCEVTVHFQEVLDQPNGTPVILSNSDLIISRHAFKNNSSKYYLNGNESSFTAVTTLLRDRGIDLDHKRFLILQGEVESIAQMKPKAANEHDDGLLEYLEDIIGTSKYKIPIEESATQVETLNEVCAEKNGRVQHVEKEKNSLEDKKNKALAYIRDENELVTKQSALYQIYVEECSNNLLVTEEAISQLQALLDTELEKHQGNEAEIKKLNKLHENGQTEYRKLEVIAQSVIREMAKFDQEHIKFEEKKKFLVDKQKKTQKNIDDSMATSTEAQLTIENCTSEIETSFKNITEMEKQINIEKEELNSIRESLKGKTQIFSDQIAEKQKSLEPWNEKISQNQSAVAISESELMILHEKANAGAVALEETKAKIACIQEDCEAKKLNLEACSSERDKLELDAREVQSELEQLATKVPELRSKLSVARQKADEARASLKNTQTQGNVLTGLMRLKESGRIDGFHGRLGNLGTIDKLYDVAISTACGALNNFVTETVEGAQQCIEYLRKTNLGRGNFLCLDKIGAKDMSPIQTPENVPRLFDLIKARDEKFRSAFYHSLQNTLVAQDLAQANRIAYGARRWRVVTLDGQLIDKSGTMSGGGNTARKGLMSYKLAADITKEQVVKLEFDRDSLEHDYQKNQDRQKELEVNLRKINEKIPLLDTKMQKIGLELESSAKNLVDAQRRTLEISKEHQPSTADSARVKSLEKVITDLKVELVNLREGSVSLEDEIRKLQEKIMQVGGEKLRAQKVKVDVLKESVDSLGEKISTAEVIRAKAEKQKIKHEKAHAKAIKDFESATVDLQGLEEEIQNQSDNAQNYQARVDEAQAELKVKKKELQSLKSELVEKTSALNEIRVIEIEMRNKLEENQKVLTENQNRLKYWSEKLGKLKLQNIDDLGENEVKESQALPEYTKDELVDMSKDALKSEIAALEEKTQNTNVDLSVLAEYRRRVEEHAMRNADLQDAISQRDTSKKRCDDLRQLRLQGFMEGFSTISLRLKEMYQMITMGGNAELELVDSLDPFSEGILFSVMPPKKSWKNISNLSGGEKTLSSLALVFALHHYKPTPLYVMDEIDAALDFRNVSIVANYIKERTKNAQFIVISLRNNMFELATRLVGVYKVNNMTKSVTIENRDYVSAYDS